MSLSEKGKTRLGGLLTMLATVGIMWLATLYASGLILGIAIIGGALVTIFGLTIVITGDINKAIDSFVQGLFQ